MISTKSTFAVVVIFSLFMMACGVKKKATGHPEIQTLSFTSAGYSTAGFQPAAFRITDKGVYQETAGKTPVELPANIYDSLKPYLEQFPLDSLRKEGGKQLSLKGASDIPYWIFTVQGPDNKPEVYEIDFGGGPDYIKGYLEKLQQTISNCKL
ncbi:hypothetical protein [Chitinophaga nivalis]|uniref:Beta-lactamase-inhibitor-like PepSY-like domain-containing protein n=1 Tax=Chitinophaga nivalis TaxID=2991709 RepID=A0ABT3IT69_9BACT|nr:hypothetical protein [Chitinophaga nivalis]MCW3463195.1 hypothetical protein [Chitinophaga nivalis]MCW3487115.1 hypothetical protein [Chitinophaga nivalis]